MLQWIFYCRKCYSFELRFVTVLFYTKQPEGQETMVGIRLKAEDGEEIHRQEADAELYAKNINEGDKVIFIEGRIEKQC